MQVLSAYLLAKVFRFNELGLWLSFPINFVAGAVVSYYIFRKGRWKDKKITETKEVRDEIEKEVEIAEIE